MINLVKELAGTSKVREVLNWIKTPVEYVQKLEKGFGPPLDYVSTDYMFWLARTAWPTLSWRVVDQGIYDDSIWVKVEISWIEDGIAKTAATIDGSDIKRTKKDSKIMELGNDFKGAVTEALKKLFNQALGICNDIYRMQFPELTEKQIEKLSEQYKPSAYSLAINQANYKQILKHTQTKE